MRRRPPRHEPRHSPRTVARDGERCWKVYRDKVTVGPPRRAGVDDVADLADTSWLLTCRLSGGTQIMAGDRPAYRVSVARGDEVPSVALLFRTAVAVVDAELGILLRLTSYLGGEPVLRYELRDITTGAGDFPLGLPPDLPIVEEPDPVAEFRNSGSRASVNIPLSVASVAARQVGREAAKAAGEVGKAAGEAAKAARDFLRRMDIR